LTIVAPKSIAPVSVSVPFSFKIFSVTKESPKIFAKIGVIAFLISLEAAAISTCPVSLSTI